MLASPAGDLPALKGWTIEPKWDGFRVLAELRAKRVHLWSRNGIDKAREFPGVIDALEALAEQHGPMLIDGELIALDRKGKPLRFQSLQQRNLVADLDGTPEVRTGFAVFDILSLGTNDLTREPWTARRKVLTSIIPRSTRSLIRLSPSYSCGSAGARKLFSSARTEGWEGLILKKMDAPYIAGARSPFWRKVKLEHEQEFVIGGYTLPGDGADREHFGALLVGYYDDKGKLHYAGKVGTGYTRATLATLGKKMASLKRATCPFVENPRRREPHVWIKPELVAQVRYNEMTEGGLLRQPAFLGLRDDKKARDVRLEEETSQSQILDSLRCAS
jgi:bifunctional non-homologous end joining protein LigD